MYGIAYTKYIKWKAPDISKAPDLFLEFTQKPQNSEF